MENEIYNLSILPIFEKDLNNIVYHIAYILGSPLAAQKLVDDVEKAILKRRETPLSFMPYNSLKIRKDVYYRINVRNYSIFYVVIGNVMEVRRILYSKRNIDKIL